MVLMSSLKNIENSVSRLTPSSETNQGGNL
jgi:hypothetical protein